MTPPIYLDYNATTPIDPRVLDAMLPWLREGYGNPSSDHVYGRAAKSAVVAAREQVAALIGAQPDEIVFTACATEANNLAILGVARALQGGGRDRLLYSAVEHPAVAMPMRHLAGAGWRVETIAVDATGRVEVAQAAAQVAIGTDVALISVMLANNEVGTLQPVAEIAARAHAAGALMHVDAAQAVGKIPVDVNVLGCDLLTLAGHKFYAPKGVGALYVKTGTPLQAIQFGAGHERGLRPGTENVPHIVALGEAARLARLELEAESARILVLREDLHRRLADAIPGLLLNGHATERLPNTLNLSFPRVAGWQLLAAASGLAASTGSACHAGQHAASGVLGAMGFDAERAAGAVRLSLGRFSMATEVEQAAAALITAWRQLAA
jgi:cysteine desulfurase